VKSCYEICCEEQHNKEKNLKDGIIRKVGLIRWLDKYTDYTTFTNFATIRSYLKQGSASASFFPKIALQYGIRIRQED